MTDLDLGLFPSRGSTPPPRNQRRLWIRRGITLVVWIWFCTGGGGTSTGGGGT